MKERVGGLLRGDRVSLAAERAREVRTAAELAFKRAFPDRQTSGARVWADDGAQYVVAVYQKLIRPTNAPTFVSVAKSDLTASVLDDEEQQRHRPRSLK